MPTMPNNLLITGPPRSGKTTVIERAVRKLEKRDFTAGGIYCPEIREHDNRVGFEIVDVASEESAVLAHVDRESGPSVGKYRVDVAAVDSLSEAAFRRACDEADFLVVDEIAPMEVESETFTTQVRRALDADIPMIAVIHRRSTTGFIGEVKRREDVDVLAVTAETREELPETLAEWVIATRG